MRQAVRAATEVVGRRAAGREYAGVVRIFLKNPPTLFGLSVILVVFLLAIVAPWVSPYDPLAQDFKNALAPPSAKHIFGTDSYGRDLLSRLIWGSRISMQVGVLAVGTGLATGILLGLTAGYFGGWVDEVLMRIVDVLLSFPGLLLAMIISAALGPNLTNVMIAIGVAMLPGFARLVRGSTLSVKELDYVQAARVLGARDPRIITRHILPNVLAPVIVWATLRLGLAILVEASLSFLGMGVQPPTPSWGGIVNDGRQVLRMAPWVAGAGGIAILFSVLGFNLVGDGVRDAFDPRLRGESM